MSSYGKAGLGVWLSTGLAAWQSQSPEFQPQHQGNSGKPSGTEDGPPLNYPDSLLFTVARVRIQTSSQLNLTSACVEAPGS